MVEGRRGPGIPVEDGVGRIGRSVIFSIAWTIDMTGSFNQSYFCNRRTVFEKVIQV